MTSIRISGLFWLAAISLQAQSSKNAFVTSVSTIDRLALVKNSIELSEWHEKSFWAQYNTYLAKMQDVSTRTYVSMEALASVANETDSAESVNRAQAMFAFRRDELALTKLYFMEIGREHNGVIALQFLQTEAQLDMMESLNVYEHTYLRSFRLNPGFVGTSKQVAAKYNVLRKAIGLTSEEAKIFYPIYTRYQQECDDIMGSDYSMYDLFAGEASDYPSGLAKRLGYDLLVVMGRELDVKEKYFQEMSTQASPSLAARFLAWEDYYSVICKMTAWAESN